MEQKEVVVCEVEYEFVEKEDSGNDDNDSEDSYDYEDVVPPEWETDVAN